MPLQVLALPTLPLTPAALGIALGAAAAGASLLLWGRVAGRFLFLAVGGGVGWWAGGLLAARMGANPLAARLTTAVVAALLGLLLTPLLWALLAGAITGGTALYFTVLHFWPTLGARAPTAQFAEKDLGAFLGSAADFAWKALAAAWEANALAMGLIAGLIGGVPFLIGAIRPRLSTVVMSSLTGGAAILAGLGCAVGLLFPSVAPVLWAHWYVLGGAAAALAVAGVGVQYRRLLRAEKDQKNREGEPPQKKSVLD